MSEVQNILKMLEEGKINSDEAKRLLENIKRENVPTHETRWLRVRVYKGESDKPKVKINIPLSLLKLAMRMGAKFSFGIPERVKEKMKEKGINLEGSPEEIMDAIDEIASTGEIKIVDVVDDESGDRVEVYIE